MLSNVNKRVGRCLKRLCAYNVMVEVREVKINVFICLLFYKKVWSFYVIDVLHNKLIYIFYLFLIFNVFVFDSRSRSTSSESCDKHQVHFGSNFESVYYDFV